MAAPTNSSGPAPSEGLASRTGKDSCGMGVSLPDVGSAGGGPISAQ